MKKFFLKFIKITRTLLFFDIILIVLAPLLSNCPYNRNFVTLCYIMLCMSVCMLFSPPKSDHNCDKFGQFCTVFVVFFF